MLEALIFTLLFTGLVAVVWNGFHWLWNSVIAEVFGGPEVTFWQAVGILILIGISISLIRYAIHGK